MNGSSISSRLFRSFAVMISLFFSLVIISLMIYIGKDVNDKVELAQRTAYDTVVKEVDSFFEQMRTFSNNLCNSEEFKKIVTEDLPNAYNAGEPVNDYFTKLYLLGYKMIVKDYRVAVQMKDNKYIWMGSNYFISERENRDMHEFTPIGLGNLKICKMNESDILKEINTQNPYYKNDLVPVISLQRDMNKNMPSYAPSAILDIEVPYTRFKDMMDNIVRSEDMNITVYTADGSVLYGEDQTDIKVRRENGLVVKEKYKKNGIEVQIQPVMNSSVYIVGSISTAKVYRPVISYLIIVFIGFLLLLFGSLMITYRISVRITDPVKIMSGKIEKVDFDGDHWITYEPVKTDIKELNILSDTIVLMQKKLRTSMDEAISLRAYELQSTMLALQAQMQPHFLYNTLMTISAMAEEKQDYEVATVCGHLMHMLRYISSEDAHGVKLSKEFRHVRDYVDIMKERFPETVVHYDIPLPMMQIIVPKLLVQPLVENSLKYSDRLDCAIQISGEIEDNRFRISIEDNGVGFSEDRIREIMDHCRELVEHHEFSTMQIDGMGLANIYARLYMFYGDDMLFWIGNRSDGEEGSRIVIGGRIECGGRLSGLDGM